VPEIATLQELAHGHPDDRTPKNFFVRFEASAGFYW
jgi:hypothetical protein